MAMHEGVRFSPKEVDKGDIQIRPYESSDRDAVVQVLHANFRATFTMLPQDVLNAYIQANRAGDLEHAVKTEGTEAYVAETRNGEIGGFTLIRYNDSRLARRNAYGDLDLRRLHVNPEVQGNGIGKKLFAWMYERATSPEINVEYITGHASGSSRPFFEHNGWTGKTILNPMTKRGTSSLVFATQRRIPPAEISLYPTPTHVVYAGSSEARTNFLQKLMTDINPSVPVIAIESDEDSTDDVVEAAKSKALSAAKRLSGQRNITPLVIASDVRARLVRAQPENITTRYDFVNKGKPRSSDPLEEIRGNFSQLRDYTRRTNRPAFYIIDAGTYFHPLDGSGDTYTEYDTSVFLSAEGLEILATDKGLAEYRDQVMDTYGADITQMSAGFALPIFFDRGYVVGLNNHPLETLPKKEDHIAKSVHTARVGIDEKAVRARFGQIAR